MFIGSFYEPNALIKGEDIFARLGGMLRHGVMAPIIINLGIRM
jgi:hypothetical protein